jgi:hypothetical protein
MDIHEPCYGLTGVIYRINTSGYALVVFDNPDNRWHDGDLGIAYKNRCWFCSTLHLELIEAEVVGQSTCQVELKED